MDSVTESDSDSVSDSDSDSVTASVTEAVAVSAAESGSEPARIEIPEIDRAVRQAISEGKLPGAVVAVGRSDGLHFLKAYGHRSLVPSETPMGDDVIFDLASLTKPLVTAALVMLLAEDGKLGLQDAVSAHLPEVRAPGVRVVDLLVHGAGLPRVNPLRDYAAGPEQAREALLAIRPEVPPGQRYLYSDVGYLWLGLLVERVAGEPLDTLAERRLLRPLAMVDSGFRPGAALRPRIAPTEITDKRPTPLIHGVVHDPRAYRLGGVAGNAGLFSTARDLARYARMMLAGGALDGAHVLRPESVQTLTRPVFVDGTARTPGWDMDSDYAKPRGHRMSGRAFGHGGYTGTSMWIDPQQDLFVIFLSHRVHPDGEGNVIALEGRVADAAVAALQPKPDCPGPGATLPGIDVLRAQDFAPLHGKRVGLVTHLAARARDGSSTLQVLASAEQVTLGAVFSPEHGLASAREGAIADGRDERRDIPIYSLFGQTRRPTADMLDGIDVLVVDLVDVGTRFYTYMSTVHQVMLAGAQHGVPVVILDRPNPLGGERVEGPMLDDDIRSFVNYHPLPVRHGLTVGELATLIAAERGIGVRLQVIEAQGWRRESDFDETGLTWARPSPNLPSPASALAYPAIGLLESTNVSVGRGTERPFEWLGAPWMDPAAVMRALRAERLPGVTFSPLTLTPTARPHRGTACPGLAMRVTDPRSFLPVRTGLALASALRRVHREHFDADDLVKLVGDRAVHRALLRGVRPAQLQRMWQPRLERFRARRRHVLRYPACGGA
jgi:uncharacterized protein YbbC (DUF1343 family)